MIVTSLNGLRLSCSWPIATVEIADEMAKLSNNLLAVIGFSLWDMNTKI
jgi:hypothetical protein